MKEKKKIVYGKDIRRALKLGRSIAVTLPRGFVKAHNIKPGDMFEVPYNKELHLKPISTDEIKEYFKRREK